MCTRMSQYVRGNNVMSVSAKLCYVCSDGRSLMSRRCFSDTVWKCHRAGDQESRCRAVMFNEISVDVLLMSVM